MLWIRRTYLPGQTIGVLDNICVVVTGAAVTPGHLRSRGRALLDVGRPACSVAGVRSEAAIPAGATRHDAVSRLEVRCIRAGDGPLVFAGRTLARRD